MTTAASAWRSSEDVYKVWQGLSPISEKFTTAAAFSNVHGVYKTGNVKLQPELLVTFQKYTSEKVDLEEPLEDRRDGGFLPVVSKAWRSTW